MKKKDLTTKQFLKAYGWPIILVILAVAVLAVLGLLNPQTYLPETCLLSKALVCTQAQLLEDGSATITIRNHDKENLNGIRMEFGTLEASCLPSDNLAFGEETTCKTILPPGKTGEKFDDSIAFYFTKTGSPLINKKMGEVILEYE